jgi:hypothetical protein
MPEDSYSFGALVRGLLLQEARSAGMKWSHDCCLSEDELRFEFRVMDRWCRLFHRSPLDWVTLVAERFRERHPPAYLEDDCA